MLERHGELQPIPLEAMLRPVQNVPEVASDFFRAFSRFEFALKRSGYCHAAKAEPDWDRFAKDLGANFFAGAVNSGQLETLFAEPPQKQTARDGKLSWKGVEPPANSQALFLCLRTMRNNLCHGAKYPMNPFADPGRDYRVLTEGLYLMRLALAYQPDVRAAYQGDF